MAKIKGTGNGVDATSQLQEAAKAVLSQNETAIKGSTAVGNVIGLEGHGDGHHIAERERLEGTLENAVEREFATIGFESLTPAQLQAGNVIAMAAANPEGYARAAMQESMPALESGDVDAPMLTDGLDVGAQGIGLEYFTEQSLDKHMAASFAFNVQSARQDEFGEAFFKTIVADPTEAGLLIEIKKTVVHRAVRHAMKSKDSKPYDRRNILDAATDPTVLEDRSIDFVPHFLEDGGNADWFVPESMMKPEFIEVGDYSVRTNPLVFSAGEKNLLELSAHPGLVSSGVLDETDEINGRVALSELYFNFSKKGEDPLKDGQLVRFNTQNLARATFNKSPEGDGREMTLDFRGASFAVADGTTDVTSQDVKALEELIAQRYQLKFTVRVSSSVNLQTGEEDIVVKNVQILELTNEKGDTVSHTEGAGKVLVDGIQISAFAYNYKATRSNANRRTKGMLVDHVTQRERYKISLGSPITSRKPVGTNSDSQRLNDLITAARMRNNNQAVTKLLGYSETLREVVAAITDEYAVPSIEGVGRHYVRAWYDEFDFDALEHVASLDSNEASDNLASQMLGTLREQVVRAYQESRFQPALEMLSGYTQSKPTVVIGTDVFTANWLYEKGDLRTLGDQFKYRIVTTNDIRFRGRIQWAFEVETSENAFSPLNFGNHLWVPELITDTNLTRSDATANELTVQPRNYHIVNCPITGVINVHGLSDFVLSKPSLDVRTLNAVVDNTPTNELSGLNPAPAE